MLYLQKKEEARLFFLHLLFYYPALFSLVYHFATTSHFNLRNFIEETLFASVLLLISRFVPGYRFRQLFLFVALWFLHVTFFIETAYFYLYKNVISESTVYIILETNFSEASDFFSMYFDEQLLRLCLLLFVPLLLSSGFLFFYLKPHHRFFNLTFLPLSIKKYSLLLVCGLVVLFCAIILTTKLRRSNFLFVSVTSLLSYRQEVKTYQLMGANKNGGKFSNVYSDSLNEELYVVVIGESTTRTHLGLYGYYRNTTPLLSARAKELEVYTDVISPHAHTINSLEKVLTMANQEHPEAVKDGTLLQLMNRAGFKTYWLSNQNPIGADETLVTYLSKAAYRSHFTNTTSWDSKVAVHDDRLIKPFEKILDEKAKKKFIVLHLMGTHGTYFRRYPKSFNRFRDTPKTAFPGKKAFRLINEYDNAVLYNDFLLDNIIQIVKRRNKKSWVLYFSDHGEDVFETKNMATHDDGIGTKPMYDIPFFFWLSEKYRQHDTTHQFVTNRKYMTDNLIHTIADMSWVHFSEFDKTASLVNKQFVERKRAIVNKNTLYENRLAVP